MQQRVSPKGEKEKGKEKVPDARSVIYAGK
jgi:hypothetical protein